MTTIQLGNFRIAYDDLGKGQVILLIHGYPLNRHMWAPQLSELSKSARVLTIDLRGHGESEMVEGTNTMEAMADDCANLLEKLDITQPVILCGLSMGGYISLAFYRKYPQKVSGLVLTATRAAADSQAAKDNRDQAMRTVKESGTTPIAKAMLPRLLSPVSLVNRHQLVTDLEQMMLSISDQTYIRDLSGLKERPDSTGLLSTISQPVLIIHGENDQIIPIDEAMGMHGLLPDSEFIALPDAGHLPNLEQPELFNKAVLRFLSRFHE